MVSITSIISFAIVLLAASSYSAPVDIQPDTSTFPLKHPHPQPVVSKRGLNEESTSVPIVHKDRSSEEKDSDEVTTEVFTRPSRGLEGKDSDEVTTDAFTRSPREFEKKDTDEVTPDVFTRPSRGLEGKDSDEVTTDVFTRPPRGFESKESNEVTTDVFTRPPRGFESNEMTTDAFTRPSRTSEGIDSGEMTTEVFTQSPRSINEDIYSSTTEKSKKRIVEDFLYTTLESSTQFNQRAIPSVESQEGIESSSPFPSNKKKSIEEEPTTSVQSFGKSTGLFQEKSVDESTEQSEKYPQDTKPMSKFPGESSESKFDTKSPSKKSVVVKPVEQEQLSQVQPQSNVEKTKPDN